MSNGFRQSRHFENLCAASVSLWWMFAAENSPQRHTEHKGSTEEN